jgi:drug/metabolite transporter (DMT)-like permease
MPGRLSDRQIGVLLAAGGILLVSLDSLWIRLSGVSSWDVAFWMGVFIFITLSVVVRLRTGISLPAVVRRDGAPIVVSGLLQTASTTFFVLAIGATTVSNTVAIVAAAPVAAALAARIIIGEQTTSRIWWAILGSVAGILIVVSGSLGDGGVSGDVYAVTAVLAFAGNVTLWRRHPEISRLAVFALGGLFIALVAVIPADPLSVGPKALAILALMGVVTGPAGRVALASSTRHLPAAQVGLFTPIETVAATIWAWLFLAEPPPVATLVGGLIVIAAVVYGSLERSPTPSEVLGA